MADRETIIETGDGGAAAAIAGLLVGAIIVVALFFFYGANAEHGKTINIDVPALTIDVAPDGK